MGYLHYDGRAFEFSDRVLAHLQVVISVKLRRGESFFLGWTSDADAGSGRHALWIDRAVPLHIQYLGNRVPAINRAWLETLIAAANSSPGLIVSKELEVPPTRPEPAVES